MSGNHQEKMTKYLDFPFDTFLMLRFEYEVIFEDELIVKVLRIIEYYIEAERRRLYREEVNKRGVPEEPLDITRDVWVPLSYKLFMSDLYGKVTSENTLKRALNYLIAHRIIFRRHEPKKRYDAPLYTINHMALQMLITLTRGYQKLIPSVLDALKNSPPQKLTPSEYQKLIPSEANLSVNDQSRVSKIDPIFKNSNNITLKESYAERPNAPSADADKPFLLSFSSEEEMIIYLQSKGRTVSLSAVPSTSATSTEDTSHTQEDVSASGGDPLRSTTDHPELPNDEETEQHTNSQQRSDQVPEEEGKILPPAPIKPEMPPNDMPWGTEKMVQLTECLRWCRGERGAVFARDPTGKSQKSQRDRQFASAKKILLEIPTLTESEYVQAYSDQNNEWWNREKGSLTVEDMAANTPRKVMRMVELLEKVRTRSERIKERPPSPIGGPSTQRAVPSILSPEERSKIPIHF